jgi:hypothetical protein
MSRVTSLWAAIPRAVVTVALIMVFSAVDASAQNVASASIVGKVTDESARAFPARPLR